MKYLTLFVLAIPFALQGQNAEKGHKLFLENGCYQCHGYAGQGGRDGARIAATVLSAPALIRYVRHPAGAMPGYSDKSISDQDLTDIHAYLKTLPAPKAVKDIPLLNDIANSK
jgi:mono/diheme cytochrome c family protein